MRSSKCVETVYGQNDAPAAWFKEFSSFVTSTGWTQSKMDQCLFSLRDPQDPSKLIALMGGPRR